MLMLMRKTGEAVDIIDRATDRVVATVQVMAFITDSQNNQVVRLGFEAPPSIKIIRDNAVRRDRDEEEQQYDNG